MVENEKYMTRFNIAILFFATTMIISCHKDNQLPHQTAETLPFENENIKLEVISSTLLDYITGVHFFNASTGVAVSYEAKIYKTTDNGVTWTTQYSNPIPDQPFSHIFFTDTNVGYVVGGSTSCGGTGCIPSGGVILKTIDGGDSWTRVLQMSKVKFVSIASNETGDLFAVANGTKGRIIKSTNSGIDWTIIDSTDFKLNEIVFKSNYGFVTGQNGKILRSSDNGVSWGLATTLSANYTDDIKFNGENGYCIANTQTVYKTIDNGNNWTQKFHTEFQAYILNPLTENSCLVFGAGRSFGDIALVVYGAIIQTTNSGKEWTETEFSDITSIRCSSFFTSTEGYAISGNRLIKVTVK